MTSFQLDASRPLTTPAAAERGGSVTELRQTTPRLATCSPVKAQALSEITLNFSAGEFVSGRHGDMLRQRSGQLPDNLRLQRCAKPDRSLLEPASVSGSNVNSTREGTS
jgi:hypothetical protein